ncbi:MAG: RNA pyrophosphohydrolase [Nitrococcus mobilis]|nr:RNA pyrophosphohydrolase [Nitrococcus mobilis]
MIDSEGFRLNVGIILSNAAGGVFWARRIGQDAWQFPQGGINKHETPIDALYRELDEEIGLEPRHVEVLGRTEGWLRYRLPRHLIHRRRRPVCVGQKQVWYMLRLTGSDEVVRLDACAQPEFDDWCWVQYWRPVDEVVFFKRRVYDQALTQLAPLLFPQGPPPRRLEPRARLRHPYSRRYRTR